VNAFFDDSVKNHIKKNISMTKKNEANVDSSTNMAFYDDPNDVFNSSSMV
jgi:hypothetical protein